MKIAFAVLAGLTCLGLTAGLAEARSLPDWDAEGQCKSMSTLDDVADDPLFKVCIEREQQALEALKTQLDGFPDDKWNECIELGNLQQSYMLFMECLQDIPKDALPGAGSSE